MPDQTRRRFLTVAAGGCIGLAGAGCVAGTPGSGAQVSVGLERIAGGFTSPLGFESPPGTDRHYVVDQAGTVETLADGETSTFLDVTDRMVSVGGYTEQGLLGLAFHPDFPDEDRCFVRYSAPRREGTPRSYSHTFVLSEFRATPERAAPDTERTLLEVPQPQVNHNSGAVAFGPDGYLYVGTGDGGGGNDQGRGHVDDWYDAVGGGNGQDVTENLLGSILRVDVDDRGSDPYGIPSDNPLVGSEGLDEQYAWGFRNPWRFSFDQDRLIVADVGQNRYEEVDVVEAGGNYGWNVREATSCFQAGECPESVRAGPRDEDLESPVLEYSHDNGIAVVGGYVYRGSAVPALEGRYVFGDWQGSGSSPTLFVATPSDGGEWPWERLEIAGDASPGSRLLAFGEDPDGEVYVCTSERGTVAGSTGEVFRFRAPGTTDATAGDGGPAGTTAAPGSPVDDPGTGPVADESDDAQTGGQPGFGILLGILGAGGGLGYRYLRGGDDRSEE